MKLVNAEISEIKIYDYCLDTEHPDGEHKARVFKAALGIDRTNAEKLFKLLNESLNSEDATFLREDEFGRHFSIEHEVEGLKGKEILRSLWVIRRGEEFPRFVSCFVKRKRR
jgi:hypothetical protein